MKKKTIEVKQISWFDDHFYKIRYENEAKVEIEDYLPSVTTKLGALAKPFLIGWYGDIGTREARLRMVEQADRGSRIHWAWEIYTQGGIVIFDDPRVPLYTKEEIRAIEKAYNYNSIILKSQDEMYQMMKLQKFMEIINPVSIESEKVVYDIENRDAGTMDNLIEINEGEYLISGAKPIKLPGGFYVFDLKTGNYLGKEARMQISAYGKCVETMFPDIQIVGGLIGHTGSKNKTGIPGFSLTYLDIDQMHREYQDFRDIARVWDRNFGTRKPIIRQVPGFLTLGKFPNIEVPKDGEPEGKRS